MGTQGTQQLAIFKIDKHPLKDLDDTLLFCGYAESQEEAMDYMVQVQNEIDNKLQDQLQGEYLVLPALHFSLKKKVDREFEQQRKSRTNENTST